MDQPTCECLAYTGSSSVVLVVMALAALATGAILLRWRGHRLARSSALVLVALVFALDGDIGEASAAANCSCAPEVATGDEVRPPAAPTPTSPSGVSPATVAPNTSSTTTEPAPPTSTTVVATTSTAAPTTTSTTIPPTTTTTPPGQLLIDKSSDATEVGPNLYLVINSQTVNISVVVTNPGPGPVTDVVVTDNTVVLSYVSGDVGGDGVLSPGEAWSYTASVLVASPNIHRNTATATGQSSGMPLSASDSIEIFTIGANADLGLLDRSDDSAVVELTTRRLGWSHSPYRDVSAVVAIDDVAHTLLPSSPSFVSSSDANGNGTLDVGEEFRWVFSVDAGTEVIEAWDRADVTVDGVDHLVSGHDRLELDWR